MRNIILPASLLLAFTACSSNSPKKLQTTVNPSGASDAVQSITELTSGLNSSDPQSVADAVLAMTAAGESVIVPAGGESATARLKSMIPDSWPRPRFTPAVTGSANCTPTSCTFDNYGDSEDGESFLLNGTISWDGTTLSVDLTFDITGDGVTVSWQEQGMVTITPTLIDGSIHSKGSANAQGESGSWDISVDYESIGLDSSGCPISGALGVSVDVSVSGSQDSGQYSGDATIDFGPSCGAYSIEG